MKRIKAACLEQTIHFILNEDLGHADAVKMVQNELAHYKARLNRSRTKYKIVEENVRADGSIIIKIKKQFNNYDCGDYLA
jgi:hypothetical protein